VDRFDIKIHDSDAGIEKSMLKHSPGEKAFLTDAYVKALIRQRNERLNRRYDPVILDEADGPINPARISAYYEMQRSYWDGTHVLVASHNPASHEHIDSRIEMREILS
jgi:hypothetical protein